MRTPFFFNTVTVLNSVFESLCLSLAMAPANVVDSKATTFQCSLPIQTWISSTNPLRCEITLFRNFRKNQTHINGPSFGHLDKKQQKKLAKQRLVSNTQSAFHARGSRGGRLVGSTPVTTEAA